VPGVGFTIPCASGEQRGVEAVVVVVVEAVVLVEKASFIVVIAFGAAWIRGAKRARLTRRNRPATIMKELNFGLLVILVKGNTRLWKYKTWGVVHGLLILSHATPLHSAEAGT
jgi:hypothetical protein